MEHRTFLIVAVFAVIIHILEEYRFDWVKWANDFIPGIAFGQFIIVNALFVILCLMAAIVGGGSIVFSSSIFSLLLVNSLIHITTTIKLGKYSPGLVSAVLIFIPLGLYGYNNLFKQDMITGKEFMISMFVGILWMSFPLIYHLILTRKQNNKNKK